MKLKLRFRFLRFFVKLFTTKYRTEWEEPFDGEPCVFCPNHARSGGPIGMVVHFQLRDCCRTWFNHGILDRKGLPAYIRNDNWWNPESRLAWLYNITIPYLVALILPSIIRLVPGIPVYYDTRVVKTFRESLEALKNREHLVIFAQYPDGYQHHASELSKGFLMIAPMAYRKLGLTLKFYPVHVDPREKVIRVMKPIAFNPELTLEEQQSDLLRALGEKVYDDPE